MAICEDAPCCGCCGPNVWAAEAASEEEAYWDRMNDPDAWYEDEDDDEEESDYDDEPGDAHIDAAMESALMGE